MGLISVYGFDECQDDEFIVCNNVQGSRAIIDLVGNAEQFVSSRAQLIITVDPGNLVKVKRTIVGKIGINGNPLRSIVGLGELEGEVVIHGVNGEVFGVKHGDKVILYATPLLLYLVHNREVLISEVKSLLDNVPVGMGINDAVRELVSIIISERRNKRVSRTLALLEDLLQGGSIDELPPYVEDILMNAGVISNNGVNRELLGKIMEEVRSKVYPRRA